MLESNLGRITEVCSAFTACTWPLQFHHTHMESMYFLIYMNSLQFGPRFSLGVVPNTKAKKAMARGLAHLLRALTAFPDGLGSIPGTHVAAPNCL